MTVYRQGDIVLLPFPFTDLSTFKQRPALVISFDEFNRKGQDLIVAAVTSHIPDKIPATDFILESADLKAAGLPKASLVKLGKIVTLDQRLIRRKMGSLPRMTLTRVLTQFHQIFGE